MYIRAILCIVAFLSSFSSAPAFAAGPVSLESTVAVASVDSENREVLRPAENAVPGDKLVFITTFHNNGAEPIENIIITNPVPATISLAEASNFAVSVDDGKRFASLASLTVPDGNGGQRAAQLADVTHIRWIVARVEPGGSGSVQYQGLVR